MPNRRAWVYNPHSGGKKIPEPVRVSTERRIMAFAAEHYAGRYRDLAVRFHGQFCYVDAFVDPAPLPADWTGPSDETAEEYQARLRDTPSTFAGCASTATPTAGHLPSTAIPRRPTSPPPSCRGATTAPRRRRLTFPPGHTWHSQHELEERLRLVVGSSPASWKPPSSASTIDGLARR